MWRHRAVSTAARRILEAEHSSRRWQQEELLRVDHNGLAAAWGKGDGSCLGLSSTFSSQWKSTLCSNLRHCKSLQDPVQVQGRRIHNVLIPAGYHQSHAITGTGRRGNVSHERNQKQPWVLSFMRPGLCGIFTVSSRRDVGDLKDFMVVPKQFARGFAKAVATRPMKLRLYIGSPGVIGEPYKKPQPPLPLLRRWFTREGWRLRKQSFMGMIKTSYAIAKLRQKTKGYSQQRFYQEVSDLYKQINTALADGERTILRQLVADSVFSVMKNELKHRENSWAKVKWEMVGPINSIRTLQGRLIGIDKNNADNAFVQLTIRIVSKQRFAAYDKKGRLVAGNPEKELLVEDFWVFEKSLLKDAKWRLCGRLSV